MQSPGAGLWLITPLLTMILLRTFGGDGWQDFGFGLNLKAGWKWYVAALLIIPLTTLMMIALGYVVGAISLSGFAAQGLGAFLSLVGAMFAASLVKNVFEEFAWRGYLTPRLEALRLRPLVNHVLTGFIWAGWHIPYWLFYLDRATLQKHTTFDLTTFIFLALIILPFQAITFGELRLLSKSVWPAWLMHNVANAVSLALLSGSFVQLNGGLGSLLSPGTEGLVHAMLFGLVGIGLYQYRMKNTPPV
jgi:membrane protease YdiL (CAAX protease family)